MQLCALLYNLDKIAAAGVSAITQTVGSVRGRASTRALVCDCERAELDERMTRLHTFEPNGDLCDRDDLAIEMSIADGLRSTFATEDAIDLAWIAQAITRDLDVARRTTAERRLGPLSRTPRSPDHHHSVSGGVPDVQGLATH